MTPLAAIVCLLFGGVQEDDPAGWKEKLRGIRPSWGRKELTVFLDGLRFTVPHRPDVLHGGLFSAGERLTFFEVYSLDRHTSLYVVWKGEDSNKGIRSTEMVRFADLKDRIDPALFEAVAAIHQSPSAQQGFGFDPVLLIRAVNVLQPMGKEKAVQALRAYGKLARDLTVEERSKHVVDEYRILPLLRLLFDAPPGGPADFGLGVPDVTPPKSGTWPLFPLSSPQDVPFMVVRGWQTTSAPRSAEEHLRPELGPMRAEPLIPRITPLEAADQLIESEGWKALGLKPGDEGRKRWQIRRQALAAVSSVFTLLREEESNDCCVDPTEVQWRAAITRAKAAGIAWSPEIQDFILGR